MDLKNKKPTSETPISKVGEFGLIQRLTSGFIPKNNNTHTAIGDDAAVIKHGKKHLLFTADMLIEGVHFDLTYTPLLHLGYKSVAVNASDIYAMNGTPTQLTISIAVSNRFGIESLEEFYHGVKIACEDYGVDLVGGDTTSSRSGFIISVSMLGEVDKKKITFRSGAKRNDLLVCTGDLGAAYLGLQLLRRENEIFQKNPKTQPALEGNDYILQRQLRPKAAKKYIEVLRELDILPTSMIDVSDGLSSEALHLSKASNVGVSIYEDKIPIDYTVMNMSEEFNLNPIFCALNGGEDYELLFTINQEDYAKIEKDPDFTIIGHITEKSEGNSFISKTGEVQPLTAQGWRSC